MVKLKHSNGFLQELLRSLHITSKVRQVGFLSQSDENHNILLVDESFNSVSKRFHFIEIVHQIYDYLKYDLIQGSSWYVQVEHW